MKNPIKYQLLILACIVGFTGSCKETPKGNRDTNKYWSVKMADAVMQRTDSLVYLYGNNINWSYDIALLGMAIDRRSGFFAGIYSQPVMDFYESYVYPQESSNRTDVRWMYLSGQHDEGIVIVADSLLSMSAWPYTEENIILARHTNELESAEFITLNIDLVQMGVGGNDSWSIVARPVEKYLVPAKAYQYSFYIIPVSKKVKEITSFSKKVKF